MKNPMIKIICLFLSIGLLASCDKEAEVTSLKAINFPQTFSSTTKSIVLTKDNGDSEVVKFNWSAVSYGIQAPVTYSLQFDLPADTTGSTAWSKAEEILVGDDLLTKGISGTELNKMAIDNLGLDGGIAAKIVVRVKSYVDRPAYSNTVVLDVIPYVAPVVNPVLPSLWVPGDYQGWNPSAAPRIVSVNNDKLYEGYIYIPVGGTLQYKYTAQPDWTPMAYGDGGNGVLIEANYSGGNFTAPSAGYYELSANLNTMKWSATKTTWGIIGDASPGGWTTDTQLTYDEALKVWSVTCDMSSTGSFKFRANGEWKIDFGIDASGNLKYADNPLYPYDGTLSNLTVPTTGNYTITLDLHNPGQYTYKLKKN